MLWNMWKTRNGYLYIYDTMQFVMIIWLIIIILVLPTEGQHELFKAEMDEKLDTTEDQSFFDIEGKNRVQRNFNEVTYFVDVQYDFDDRFYNCDWNMMTNVMKIIIFKLVALGQSQYYCRQFKLVARRSLCLSNLWPKLSFRHFFERILWDWDFPNDDRHGQWNSPIKGH